MKARVLKTEIVNLGKVPGTPKIPTNGTDVSTKWIPFTGDKGEANQFPNEINTILQQSPTLRAVVASKRDYSVGDELTSDKYDVKQIVNSNNDTFEDVYSELFYYLHAHNSAWLQMAKKGKDVALYVINPGKVRYMLPDGDKYTHVGIHADWKSVNIRDVEQIALYTGESTKWTNRDGMQLAMVHIKQKDSDVAPYSVPDWLGAQFYAKCEYLTGTFNYDTLENGMFLSGVLDLVGEASSDEEGKNIAADYQKFLMGTGNGNAGKVLIRTMDSIDNKTSSFTPLADVKEGHFEKLSTLCTQKIITGCRWFSSLAGIQTPGALGSNQQILNEYRIALKTLARPREIMQMALNGSYFREIGIDVNIEHLNQPIVDDESWDSGQVTSTLGILEAVKNQTVTKDQAVSLLVTAYNISEKEAKSIVG